MIRPDPPDCQPGLPRLGVTQSFGEQQDNNEFRMKRIRYFPNSLLSHSDPTKPQWVVTLLKRQQGRCSYCG